MVPPGARAGRSAARLDLADVFVEGEVSLFFERDRKGRLTGYRLNTGRVRNLWYQRRNGGHRR